MKINQPVNIILLPVDFSDNSLNACRYAFIIAKKTHSKILLFHACYSPAFDLIQLTVNPTTRKKLREDVELNLLSQVTPFMINFIEQAMKLPECDGFKSGRLEYIIKPGTPKEEIPKIATEYQPDLVIMGTHGKDNSTNNLLGSVTKFAINKLPFPVLAIPPITGLHHFELESVVYLTDFDETDFQSIKKLLDITGNLKLKIHCIHIGEGVPERKKLKMTGLINYFKSSYGISFLDYHIIPFGEKTNLPDSIKEYINGHNISIISLTHKKRNILKKYFKRNLTNNLFQHIKLPLLVFHS